MNLSPYLSQLESIDIVRQLKDAELAYAFRHQLTQETVYHSLLNKSRREIHRAVAQVYEEFYRAELDQYAALLAVHYAEAGDDVKTFEYALRAGQVARRKNANAEALANFSRARAIVPRLNPPREAVIHLYDARGDVLEVMGRHDAALENYAELHRIGVERNDRALELAALMESITVHSAPTSKFNPDLARQIAEQAFHIADELNDRAAEAKILWNLMLLNGMTGNRDAAMRYGEQALFVAREKNLRETLAFILNDMYRPYIADGKLERGLEVLEEAQGLWKELDNQNMLTDNLSSLAMLYTFSGQYARALAAHRDALATSEAIGNLWGQSFSRLVVGKIFFDHGEIAHAIDAMEKSVRYGQEAGFIVAEIWAQSDLAHLYTALGDQARGIEIEMRAREVSEKKFPRWLPYTLGTLARGYAAAGNLPEAEAYVKQAIAGLKESEFYWEGDLIPYLAETEIALAQ
ncbi:MAG: tetratricopeptide repeat protein, partial [Chloroflexi bacterium]|nr:tetratricopeptide repeat protein [Chloroflexota bacterium]